MAGLTVDLWHASMPEPKLELIDGRLVVGNSNAGNVRLLANLLEGWGASAALALAPAGLWWQALHAGFREFEPPAADKAPEVWRNWAGQLSYTPELPPAGPMSNRRHNAMRQRLTMELFGLTQDQPFAHVVGRDVIMRLGDDAFTPDGFVTGPRTTRRLNEHYLDGPADLVFEVLFPGHESADRDFKFARYARGGVPEYWVVDPAAKTVGFFRADNDNLQRCEAQADGTYRPAAFPGVVFSPQLLWETNDWGRGPNPFRIDQDMPPVRRGFAKGGVAWGDLPFDPQPGLEARRLSFDQFASWAPQAKFELIDGQPWVGGSRGSRNVLGMLLRTAGLAEAVRVLHPRVWLEALAEQERSQAEDAERRVQWWAAARRAAELLRERFGVGRLVVIGDLVRPAPLNLWSMITLVAFDLGRSRSSFDAYQAIDEALGDDPPIDLISAEHATKAQREAIDGEAVEL
jgi:Uma2 family endonuclease